MKAMKLTLLCLAPLAAIGCGDSERNVWRKIGSKNARLTCYSGTATIFDGNVTSLITEDQSDGWNFYDANGKWVRVSGSCVAVHQ